MGKYKIPPRSGWYWGRRSVNDYGGDCGYEVIPVYVYGYVGVIQVRAFGRCIIEDYRSFDEFVGPLEVPSFEKIQQAN